MRIRSKDLLSPQPTFLEEAKDVNCSSSSTYTPTGSSIGGLRLGDWSYMEDVVAPRFHRRVEDGEIIFNPMVSYKTNVTSFGGKGVEVKQKTPSCSSPVKYAFFRYEGDELQYWCQKYCTDTRFSHVPHFGLISQERINDACTQASTDLLSKLGGGNANLIESIAEARQLMTLFPDLFKNAIKIITAVKRKDPKGYLNGTASAYLAFRYGLQPLVSDILAILKALKATGEKVRVPVHSSIILKDAKVNSENRGGGLCTRIIGSSAVESYTIRATALEEYQSTFIMELGLTGKNLLTVPWELIRLSFVLDWFLSVGDYIRAVTPNLNSKVLGSCLTIKRDLSCQFWPDACQDNASFQVTRQMTGHVASTVVIKRRQGLASPGIVVKSDFRFDKPTRVLDAVALLYQVMSSGSSRTKKQRDSSRSFFMPV